MKYSLYSLGEGLLADSPDSHYAVVNQQHEILDASISLRKKGVLPGMALKTAKALYKDIHVVDGAKGLSCSMQRVLNLLCTYTPWIQTERNDAFYIQLSDGTPPVCEVRNLLLDIDNLLSLEQRLRVGFAENPFLARALVEWSQIERIPDAIYRKVGRQCLIISPGLVRIARNDRNIRMVEWWGKLPVRALWTLSGNQREKLLKLGVYRLKDFRRIPDQALLSHFGKESLLWKQILSQQFGGSVFVNYPTYEKKSFWIADIHDKPDISSAGDIAGKLSQNLSNQLSRLHVGAMRIGIRCRTDRKEDERWRACKQPVFRSGDIFARIQPFLNEVQGTVLECIEIFGADIQSLMGIQTSFVLQGNQFRNDTNTIRADMNDVLSEIDTRFPNRLQVGVKPTFREIRLHKVMGGT
jgi:protein ImuB